MLLGTADQARQRVIPERDPPGGVDHGDSLIERLRDFEMTTFALTPAQDGAVEATGEVERHQRQRRDVPGLADHRFDQGDGKTGSDDTGGEPGHACERVGRADTSSHSAE